MKNVNQYLFYYSQQGEKILLVSRPTDAGWSDRCFYGDKKYNPFKHYNHRSILREEIVFEWDTDTPEKNKALVDEVARRLKKDGLPYAKWHSGNKSYHLHTLVNIPKEVSNVTLFKKVFVRHYTKELPLPDMQLTSNHLIRAEYGLHEKTGNSKKLISQTEGYPKKAEATQEVWDKYYEEQRASAKRQVSRQINKLSAHPAIKLILKTESLGEVGDGRRRALFILANVLKPEYEGKLDELFELLRTWYKYTGGNKLTDEEIRRIINYHKVYTFSERYLMDFIEEIGLELPKEES